MALLGSNMTAKTWVEIIMGVLGLLTATVVLLQKIKEAKAKKKDPSWKPNPIRCQEERDRVTALEGQNKVWTARFDAVDDSLDDIKAGLKTLTDLHLRP